MESKIVWVLRESIIDASSDLAYHPGLVSPPSGSGSPFIRVLNLDLTRVTHCVLSWVLLASFNIEDNKVSLVTSARLSESIESQFTFKRLLVAAAAFGFSLNFWPLHHPRPRKLISSRLNLLRLNYGLSIGDTLN